MDPWDQLTDAQKLVQAQHAVPKPDDETAEQFSSALWSDEGPAAQATDLQRTSPIMNESTAFPVYDDPFSPSPRNPDRRKFIGYSLGGVAVAGAIAVGGGMALKNWLQSASQSKPVSAAGDVQIGHLLRRAGFGASASEMAMYQNMGYEGAINHLLDYEKVDDSAMERRLNALNLDMDKAADQQRWVLLRMAWTQRPLLEKMTLFLSGVLTSSFRKVGGPKVYRRIVIQNQFLRSHAFDTYDAILLGITADPAMLAYLDLGTSTAQHPNENYARELMELFTLGVGNYTQQDVSEVAAALTGWRAKGYTSSFIPSRHNNLTKHILGQTGNFDYKDVVRILAAHPSTPLFIGHRLFSFFVHENPTNDDLKPLVDAYTTSGHNMGAVMRALLFSPQFASSASYRSRIKSPIEFLVEAYRSLDVQESGASSGTGLSQLAALMGQPVFEPPNVAGWPGDKVSTNWLSTGAWMTRLNYIDRLLVQETNGLPMVDLQKMINDNKLSSPDAFVDHFSGFLLDGPLPTDRRTSLLQYFTATDNSSSQHITLTNGQSYPLNRVRGTLYLLMSLPEYQLN